MADGLAQFTLRKLRAHLGDHRVQVVVLGVGLMLGISGPFETGEAMRFLPRIAYWVGIVASTYVIGSIITLSLRPRLEHHPLWLRATLIGLALGCGTNLFVQTVNSLIWPIMVGDQLEGLAMLALSILVLCLVISTVFELVSKEDRPGIENALPPVLDRLPPGKRGALVALSVEDHYTRVRTTKGEELLLLRLSDAIRETSPVDGLQVHRSHWVAIDQVTGSRRDGDRTFLILRDGKEIPVSRANVPAAREAGMLPRH